jgi:cell division protein FtsL
MEKVRLESLLIEYIDGSIGEAEKVEVEQVLASSESARKLYDQLKVVIGSMEDVSTLEPSNDLRSSFNQLLEREIAQQKQSKVIFFQPSFYRLAAAVAFLIMAVSVGYWINKNQEQQRELAALREQVEENKRMMMAMINNDQSASQRMMGVAVAYELNKPDDEIVKVLVRTMNEDPNTNVRMAALEALSKFHSEPTVRQALIHSLTIQKDPIVQIALIQIMVVMKEKGVVKELERMTKETTIKAVKDEALAGIMRLS